ncbi:peptidoglycan editing factor PgeF [Acidithiobacillus sp. IBUN Pt1247-S3]|uniref:peptidoglycan editing factor PgeF n=1 Tax=Acidithiobacillus sp. IBUN Pt1247-S3 TaxID=3166642 RepID=UPI0034E60B01
MSPEPQFLALDWPFPAGVHAAFSTRQGGSSQTPWESFNLADHVGDAPDAVAANRRLLRNRLALPNEPLWLQQVHGIDIAHWEAESTPLVPPKADAALACNPGATLAILTADCLPVLAASRDGRVIAALHAGWRGLAAGILEAGMRAMQVAPEEILLYLGPAIGAQRYEVGAEVRAAFLAHSPQAELAFRPHGGRYLADLYLLARQRLAALGVTAIYGGEHCTYTEEKLFFSYRRDGQCGRMASLIWREGQ